MSTSRRTPVAASSSLAKFQPPKEFTVYHEADGRASHANHFVEGQLVKQIRVTPAEQAAKPL